MSKSDYLQNMGVEVWRLRADDDIEEQAATEQEKSPEVALQQFAALEVQSSNVFKLELPELSKVVAQCEKCNLSRTRTNVVFGTGSDKARLMFIGEAPGADEDLEGKPFVGKAGRLLTSIITALGLNREDVYISNVLKCRPPNNRDPSPSEASCCSPYLQRQIQLIDPDIIVALGRVSAQLLLDTERTLGQLRRERHHYRDTGIEVVVTYHPAYLLRRLTEKVKVWEDLIRVRELLNQ